jgi:hypothetical protein
VNQAVSAALAAWENFYIIVGSSAGALTGLQFVVMALIAESRTRAGPGEVAAFGTPTVLHFTAALLVSALLSVPWASFTMAGYALGACGIAGTIFTAIVILRARKTQQYRPQLEDWVWHALLPILAYVVLLVAALLIGHYQEVALPLTAGSTLGLVIIGIRNSWDTIVYIAVDLRLKPEPTLKEPAGGAPRPLSDPPARGAP